MPTYVEKWQIQSFSNPSKIYVVSRDEEDRFYCSCPHFLYRLRKRGGECKHIRLVKSNMETIRRKIALSSEALAEIEGWKIKLTNLLAKLV